MVPPGPTLSAERAAPQPRREMAESLERAPKPPPDWFTFDLYDPARIPIDVGRRDFDARIEGLGIGGLAGLGSLVQGLTYAGGLLNDATIVVRCPADHAYGRVADHSQCRRDDPCR